MKKWKMVWCGDDPSEAKVFGVYIENYPTKFLEETVLVEEPCWLPDHPIVVKLNEIVDLYNNREY